MPYKLAKLNPYALNFGRLPDSVWTSRDHSPDNSDVTAEIMLSRILLPVIALLVIGGFAYLAFTDIPVEQNEIRKVIPNERFFGKTSP